MNVRTIAKNSRFRKALPKNWATQALTIGIVILVAVGAFGLGRFSALMEIHQALLTQTP